MSEQKRKMLLNVGTGVLLMLVATVIVFGIASVAKKKQKYDTWQDYIEIDYVNHADTYTRDCFFDAQYIRTNGYMEEMEYPMVRIIRSTDELNAYYEEYKEQYYLERREQVYADTTIGFLDACDRYDEDYFKDQILILVLLEEGSGSIRHEISGLSLIERKGERILHISIHSIVPEMGTDDMAQWHLMIEPEEGLDVEDESHITVSWGRR